MRRFLTFGARRLNDDRGSVGILVALAMFFVMGMLAMTYNTARLSTEKMRLQNAADAAALEHAAWQARGMNIIQNLNNEGFTALCFADELLTIACGINVVRFALETAERATPPPVCYFFKVLEVTSYYVIKAMLWVSSWIANGLVGTVITYLQTICLYTTPLVGYISAQLFAEANGAEPLGGYGAHLDIGGAKFGAYALGAAVKDVSTLFVLPLEREKFAGKTDSEKAPFITDNHQYQEELAKMCGKRTELKKGVPKFNFTPMVSKKLKDPKGPIKWVFPSPTVWICYKDHSHIKLVSLNVWDKGFETKDPKKGKRDYTRLKDGHGGYGRMMAIAAAQCVTGDVVKQSVTAKKDSFCTQRPAGLGCGATAKLVPVTDVLDIAGGLIYH